MRHGNVTIWNIIWIYLQPSLQLSHRGIYKEPPTPLYRFLLNLKLFPCFFATFRNSVPLINNKQPKQPYTILYIFVPLLPELCFFQCPGRNGPSLSLNPSFIIHERSCGLTTPITGNAKTAREVAYKYVEHNGFTQIQNW